MFNKTFWLFWWNLQQKWYLFRDGECFRITKRSCDFHLALASNQEETDTKVILHSINVIKKSELGVALRSPSDDTDITVLAVALIDVRNRVLFDYGNEDNRTTFWLNNTSISDEQRSAIKGFHANDFYCEWLCSILFPQRQKTLLESCHQ